MRKTTLFKNLLSRPGAVVTPVVYDALTAKIAQRLGFEALSVGGFAVAGVNYGLPDVGLIGLSEMAEAVGRIANSVALPVFADADGGYGNERNVAFTVGVYERVGAASLFIEDQEHPKRCGHMNGKKLISAPEMAGKIGAAVSARSDQDFVICARTDGIAVEGFEAAISRAKTYIEAGADMIFVEAPEGVDQLREIPKRITEVPLLVNMLEGGKTPLCTKEELEGMGYKMIAYPVTTLFAAAKAVEDSLRCLKEKGDTSSILEDQLTFQGYKDLVDLERYL